MSHEDLSRRILSFLKGRGAPASSLLIADRFLRMRVPGEEAATRLLLPILSPAGLHYVAEAGWWTSPRLAEGSGGGSAPRGERGAAAPSAAGGGAEGPDEIAGKGKVVACAVLPRRGTGRGSAFAFCLIDVGAIDAGEGVRLDAGWSDPGRGASGLDWRAAARLLDGAEAVFSDPEREAPPLLAELRRRSLPGPARVRSLAAAVRPAVRVRREWGPEEICGALGAPYRDGHSPEDAAANVASCLLAAAALERPGRRARIEAAAAGGPPEAPEAPSPAAARAARALDRTFLAGVPRRPGVYRFLDEDGGLLYVGKAADLRRRLSRHAARAAGPGRLPRALARLDRVEYEVLGSELEALLEEARLIGARSPGANVQREVRERGRSYAPGRTQAIVLPAEEAGSIAVVFLKEGRYEGWVRLGPRRGGAGAAGRMLRRLLRGDPAGAGGGSAPKGNAKPLRPRGRLGGKGRPFRAETEILNSWLARNADRVTRVDLDACRDAEQALRLLEAARREAASGGWEPTLRRG